EKYWARGGLTREATARWGMENLYDILALGFDPARTHVFFDSKSIAALYPLAIRVARKIPYSTVKAVFGFEPSTNIGLVFYTALQTVPCFWPSWAEGRTVPCLIPCGIDQDPHFRVTRDIAEGLGYPKPALLHSQMLPGLLGDRRCRRRATGPTTPSSSTTRRGRSNGRSARRSRAVGRPSRS
ncbi:Cytoplasmic tryptophanyl-tRNA synthetase, aminoacylates tryptophanyl-tRNA, partial [mine drainage metagenome]